MQVPIAVGLGCKEATAQHRAEDLLQGRVPLSCKTWLDIAHTVSTLLAAGSPAVVWPGSCSCAGCWGRVSPPGLPAPADCAAAAGAGLHSSGSAGAACRAGCCRPPAAAYQFPAATPQFPAAATDAAAGSGGTPPCCCCVPASPWHSTGPPTSQQLTHPSDFMH